MKKLLSIVLSVFTLTAAAQWSDTENHFDDTLHMPVSVMPSTQKNPIVLTSYPDGGYFVIWEDDRNYANTKTDIYAQKYDVSGNALWAAGGLPVSAAPDNQHYTWASNQDYRNRSFAATDSAGGFYITYGDDSASYYTRITVQHVRSNGTKVFPEPGYIIAQSGVSNLYNYSWPQLVADGNKGFFIAYKQTYYEHIHAYCYRDEGGKMVFYGGGRMNENAYQSSSVAPCGIKTTVNYPGQATNDFNIWYDGDGGCNVIMQMVANNGQGTTGPILAYNRLWRAKKDSRTRTYFRNTSGSACPRTAEYKKGDVYVLYYLVTDFQSVACGGGGGPLYVYTNYRLISNGYMVIDQGNAYDHNYPKGVTLKTDSNINVNFIAVCRRKYENSTLSDFTIQGYAYPVEKFDSIPYQRISFFNPEAGYNYTPPEGMKKLNNFRDTILAFSSYYTDFTLAAGGNHIYIAGLMGNSGSRYVRLQNLEVSRKAADSFALEYKTNFSSIPEKTGAAIGREVSTGFGSNSISYDHPLITFGKKGNAIFHIREYGRAPRVSPIGTNAQLEWGAMGRPIGTNIYLYNGSTAFYTFEQPVVAVDSNGNTGIIAWKDYRAIDVNGSPAYENIFIRSLNRLDQFNHIPPPRRLRPLSNASVERTAYPSVMYGSSKEYSLFEVYNSYNYWVSPVLEIKDDNYLGNVEARVYQYVGATPRRYNNEAFLNWNYNIKPDSIPPNSRFDILLYMTTQDFNALKAADVGISDPGALSVIRQPATTAVPPVNYTPVAGEEVMTPTGWYETDGGYAIRIVSKGTGNFFVKRLTTLSLCSAANGSFTSNVSGSSYKWQVNTGSGTIFSDITNNTNYSGATTATLQLTNIPASFNGYRYRCLVNNGLEVSNTFYLQLANTWTGAVNNLWETAGNWSCGNVPDANTDVIINSGTVTVNSNAACRSAKISPAANVSVTPGFKLTVTH